MTVQKPLNFALPRPSFERDAHVEQPQALHVAELPALLDAEHPAQERGLGRRRRFGQQRDAFGVAVGNNERLTKKSTSTGEIEADTKAWIGSR